MLNSKRIKNYKIIFTITFLIILLTIAILGFCLKWEITFIISLYSIAIALMSLVLAIMQINISKIMQDENDYKKFLISFLEIKLKALTNAIENYLIHMYIYADMYKYSHAIDMELLVRPVFKNYFSKCSEDLHETTSLHKAKFENRIQGANRDDELLKEEKNLAQIKYTIIEDINNIIVKLYNGELQISDVEQIEYERRWFH